MSVFIVAFMAMLGAMAAVAIAPILLGLVIVAGKFAVILGLALGAKWVVRKVIRKTAE